MVFLIIISIIVVIWIVVYIFNETTFLYKEPQEYVNPDLSKLMHKNVAPVYHINNNDKAIMFVHGFTGNPNQFIYISDLVKKENFDIITPLLPGAGTSTEDFKKSYFSQWYNSIRDTYLKYRKNYKYFFIVGLSMGSALTLRLTEEFNNSEETFPTAIACFSAPVFLNSLIENKVLKNPGLYISRFLSCMIKELPEKAKDKTQDGADRAISYNGTFPVQLHSLKMGLKKVKKSLSKITVPMFLAQSKGDKVVPFENLFYIAKKVKSKDINMKVYDITHYNHSRHTITIYDSTRDDLYNRLISFIKEHC